MRLDDLGITIYELLDGGARWWWDIRYITPREVERMQEPPDEALLQEIDEALDRRVLQGRRKEHEMVIE